MELDVHATADGHVVVLHDADLGRTTDGSGPVRMVSLAALRECDAGARFLDADGSRLFRGHGVRVPTLDELLAAHPGVPLNIEIKQDEPAIEAAVLAVLDRHGARETVLLAAEHQPIMDRIRAAAPDVVSGSTTEEVAEFIGRVRDGRMAGWRPPGFALQVPARFGDIEIVSPETVAAAHACGVEVHVWTVNDAAEMTRLLDLGVDGIMTDVPALGARVLRERGMR